MRSLLRPVVVFESPAAAGRAGPLWAMLESAGLPRAACSVVTVVAEDCEKIRARQIREAGPALAEAIGERAAVLLVGNVPLEAVTGKRGIKQRRGRPWLERGECVHVPILPPGVLAYDERSRPMMQADCQLFADVVRRGKIPREESLDWTIVDTRKKFDDMLADLRGTVSFDVETGQQREDGTWTGCLNPWLGHVGDDGRWVLDGRLISVGFGTRTRQWCLPVHHPEAHTEQALGLTFAQIFARVDRRMQRCRLVAHNGKFDSLWLKLHAGVDWRADFDTMIAHWMLDENSLHGLKILAQVHCAAPNYDADKDEKGGAGPLYSHCEYLAHDVFYTRRLRFKLGEQLETQPGVARAFERIMMPIASLFVDVELRGVLVDVDRFEEAEVKLRDQLRQARKELHKACAAEIDGYKIGDVNWRSPQQLAKLFFETLGLKPLDRTKSGKSNSTSESVLTRLDHPVAVALLKYRGADQTLKMFIDGWRPFLVRHEDGWRLHPSFKLIGTVTGRASCEHPNLQQVPRDSLIRSLIMAAAGWQLFEMDLSQIEMRISAELSGDQTLLGIFERDEDVHWRTMIRSISGSGGGQYKDACLQIAEMFLLQCGLPADGASAEAVSAVWTASPSGAHAETVVRLCCEKWKDQSTWSREWRGPDGAKESAVERWCKSQGLPKPSPVLLSALRRYGEALHLRGVGSSSDRRAPQGRESKKQRPLEFGHALSILSCVRPSVAEGFDACWKEARKKAKAVGFGFLFGMWWKKFAAYARDNYGITVTDAEAQRMRRDFFDTYSALAPWHERQRRYARRHGYVTSLSGARRRLPDAQIPFDCPARGEALRQAINSPVQRFACELNYMVLLQLVEEFGLDVIQPVGTVHDAILAEVREDRVADVYRRCDEIMRHPKMLDELDIRIRVPIKGEAKIGAWSKGVSLDKWQAARAAA